MNNIKDYINIHNEFITNYIKIVSSKTDKEKNEYIESLKTNINNIRNILKELYKKDFINTNVNNSITSSLYNFEQNIDSIDLYNSFNNEYYKAYTDIIDNIKIQFNNNKISLEEIVTLKDSIEDTEFKKLFDNLIDDINKNTNTEEVEEIKNDSDTSLENNAGQTAIEDNEGSLSNNEQVNSDFDNMSLDQLLQSIAFSGEDEYSKSLFEGATEYNIDTIKSEMNKLREKKAKDGKLSFSESVKLHNLAEQESLFYESQLIKNPNQAIRDFKLSFNQEKQNKYSEKIDNLKSVDTTSFIGNFVSSKLMNHYDNKMKKLKQKEAKLIKSQRLSMMSSLKLQRNAISFVSGIKTAAHGVTKIPSEFKKTVTDVKHIFSNPERLYELRRQSIVMTSNPQVLSINTPELIDVVSRSI